MWHIARITLGGWCRLMYTIRWTTKISSIPKAAYHSNPPPNLIIITVCTFPAQCHQCWPNLPPIYSLSMVEHQCAPSFSPPSSSLTIICQLLAIMCIQSRPSSDPLHNTQHELYKVQSSSLPLQSWLLLQRGRYSP